MMDTSGIFYEVRGTGRPVLMLHGWSLDHHHMMIAFEPVFAGRSGWERIYLDLPGHGRSPAPDSINNQDDILMALFKFIKEVIGDQHFLLVGASAGAYLARGVLQRLPEQIDGLALIVPMIVAQDAQRTRPDHVTLVESAEMLAQLGEGEEWLPEMVVVQSLDLLERLRAFENTIDVVGDLIFQQRIREDPQKYAFTFDVDQLEHPFPAPTLIAAGRQDSVVGYRDAWRIIENYPRATFAVLDSAGHMLEDEQGAVLSILMDDWLKRVEVYLDQSG
jgi:pimeloyl-ACP methyl ester carboxylesterase